MEKRDFVPEFETCQRLKELGWKKSTLFIYSEDGNLFMHADNGKFKLGGAYYAPTFQELVTELPPMLDIRCDDGIWTLLTNHTVQHTEIKASTSLNDGAAKLWISLKQKGWKK